MAHSQNDTELVGKLAGEFVERYRRGERSPISEYVARYPEHADDIRELFPALVLMENVGPSDDVAGHQQPAHEEPRPQLLGDFRIIREVGRGGMGVVYEAEQVSLGRRVALKVLPKQTLLDSKHAKRFEREARAAAKLHHTNIVPVFGVGQQDGLHYYVMQFIHGLGLDEVLVELKRLREASEFPHATAEQQIASVVAAGAAEKAAVGRDVSALDVAQSLVSGRFERTLIVESDSGSRQPSAVSDQESGDGGGPATTRMSPLSSQPATHEPLPDTTVGRLSETAAGSGAYALPGQSEQSSKAHSRSVYWQSVARIGVQAAEALQYAHDQGVIHRDVKPGNLLLDTRGCVWVTDFGLAKATDQQDLTHTGDVLGTLRYMAPEQFNGQADARSDVYALGLTLYELLALQPGFDEKDRHKLIKQVTTGAPVRLRTVDPHIPRDLETIVHKAMERDAAQRYQTAGELAADLQRYLGDEPIRARRISPVTRFARWCKRNPAVASLTTTIAVLLAAAAAISSVAAVRFEGLAAEKGRLVVQANTDKAAAQAAQKDAEEARDHEKELREEAERQKDRANTNFSRARRAVDAYLSKVTEEQLLSVPGLQPLREDLLREALKFYAEFTAEQSDDPTLQVELASAQYRLGVIQRDLRNKEASQAANKEAIRLLEALRDQGAGGVDVLTILADAYFMAERYDDTIQLCQEVLETNPEHAAVSSTLAETYNTLAKGRTEARDLEAALEYHRQAFEIRQKLVQQHPDDAAHNAALASTINNLGVLLNYQHKIPESLAMFQLALPYNEKACRLAPHSVMWGQWMAISLRNIGASQRELGQQAEALASFQRQADVWRRLVAQNPAVSYIRSDYYKALLLLADQQKQMGLTVEANRSNRDALDMLAQLPRETPAELFELATVHAALAAPPDPNLELVEDTPDAADERQRQADLAMETLQQAVDAGWVDPAALKNYKVLDPLREREQFQQLAKVVEAVGEAQRLLSGTAATDAAKLTEQQKALDVLNKLGADAPEQKSHQRVLASTYHSIGVIQTGLKQFEEAETSLNEALRIRQELLQRQGDDPQAAVDVFATQFALGKLYWDSDRLPEAHRRWQHVMAELETLSTAHQEQAAILTASADIERQVCLAYGQLGLWPLAAVHVDRNVRYGRTTDLIWDTRLAPLMLLTHPPETYRQYWRLCEEFGRTSRPGQSEEQHRGGALVWTYGLLDNWEIPADKVSRMLADAPRNAWFSFCTAVTQYRTGQLDFAANGMRQWVGANEGQTVSARLFYALCEWSRDRKEAAESALIEAETAYRRFYSESLSAPHHPVNGNIWSEWWWFVYAQQIRREAYQKIRQGAPPDDPWQHLIQARGYQLIGEGDKAEAELGAAKAAVPGESNDADFWLAVARLHGLWNEDAAAVEASWAEAIKQGGTDPLPLIHRGRWYAERGEHEKADADFARAASVTPNELNKFLEAGWWVVGPYPSELRTFCPPEFDPDPSQPVRVIYPGTGISDDAVKWRTVPSGKWGTVERKNSVIPEGNTSVYALAYVHSPEEQTKLLMIGRAQPLRVWVNGTLVEDFAAGEYPVQPHYEQFQRVPVVLRAGRNTLLVKSATPMFLVRIADTPRDRAVLLAEQRRFAAAAKAFNDLRPTDLLDITGALPSALLPALALEHEDELYERACKELANWSATQPAWAKNAVAYYCAHTSNPVFRQHAEQFVAYAEGVVAINSEPWVLNCAAMVNYRAGKFDRARSLLEQSTFPDPVLPLRALLAHERGDKSGSEENLNQSLALAGAHIASWDRRHRSSFDSLPFLWWYEWATYLTLLREAEQAIRNDTTQSTALRQRSEVIMTQVWTASPERGAFDLALLHNSRSASGNVKFPQPFVARGKRLAELGRFKEAEVDFNQAVELAPADANVLAARAVFYADHGQSEKGAADFLAALNCIKERWRDGVPIDVAVAARSGTDPAFETFNAHDGLQRLARILTTHEVRPSLVPNTDWTAPEQAYIPACVALLNDDHAEFERLRNSPSRTQSPYFATILLGLAPTTEPMTSELLACAGQMSPSPNARWVRRFDGMALLRAGRYDEALERLQSALDPSAEWQADGVVYPLLALAEHHLGHADVARTWLDKSRLWLNWHMQISDDDAASLLAANRVLPRDWLLLARVYWREAVTLIDGPEAVATEFAKLTAPVVETQVLRATPEQRLEESYNRAVAAAPNDPLPLIHRGRWYAERGEHEKADADFAQAASLTPHELNKFLEAGWWVVGPYPADLSEFCPPEIDPDPSQPVRVIDPGTGISDDAVKWRTVPSGKWGTVERKNSVIPEGNTSVYALAYVHSPEEQTKLLMIGRAQPLRVWVNGTLVEDFAAGEYPVQPHYEQFQRVPVVLRAGRNTLLIKSVTPMFLVRIADTPRDRAVLLAEQRRFSDAAKAFDDLPLTDKLDKTGVVPIWFLAVLALEHEDQSYERVCSELVGWAATQPSTTKHAVAYLCAQTSNAVFEQHVEQLVAYAEELVAINSQSWVLNVAALVNYRAGRFERARSLLAQSTLSEQMLPLRALLAHQSGDKSLSEKHLDESLALAGSHIASWEREDRSSYDGLPFPWWFDWATYLTLLREAEQAIRNDTTQSTALYQQSEAIMTQVWTASPERAAFDLALLHNSRSASGGVKFPQPFVARGRRLAELGRFDEAEADFNRAVELAPAVPDVLGARAAFFAARGDPDKAAAEFARAYGRAPDHPAGRLLAEMRQPNTLRVWNFAKSDDGWDGLHQCVVDAADGMLAVKTTGDDPHLRCDVWAPPGSLELTLCARIPGDLDHAALYWATSRSPNFSEEQATYFRLADSGGQWRVYRIFFHAESDLRSLRFDPANRPDLRFELAWAALSRRTLEDALALHPGDSHLLAQRARQHLQSGLWDQAADDFSRLLDADTEDGWSRSQRVHAYIGMGDYARAQADAETLLAQSANPIRAYESLAEVAVARADWRTAHDAVDKQIELEPQESAHWPKRALLLLTTGDTDAYARYCTELLARHSGSTKYSTVADVAWCCALANGGVADAAQLLSLANRIEREFPRDWPWSWPVTVIHYRSGNYTGALARLNSAVASGGNNNTAWEWLFLAMTHHQLGHRDEALKWFEQATIPDQRASEHSLPWFYRLDLQLLRREAAELLGVDAESTGDNANSAAQQEPGPPAPD